MINKTRMITLSTLAVLALSSFGVLAVSAWNTGASYTCIGTSSITTNCPNDPSFSVGTKVYDTLVVKDTGGQFEPSVCPPVIGQTDGCVSGSATFYLYANSGCTGSSTNLGTVNFANDAYPDSVYTSTTINNAGSYSFQVVYTGDYSNGAANTFACEPFSIFAYSTPQFPLGSLGMLALLGMMVPLMLLARSRFAKNLPL